MFEFEFDFSEEFMKLCDSALKTVTLNTNMDTWYIYCADTSKYRNDSPEELVLKFFGFVFV